MASHDRLPALAGIVALAVACGGCRPKPPPPDLSKFLGTWAVVSARLQLTCSTKQTRTIPVSEPIRFVRGTTSDLLDQGSVCPVAYNVSGDVAAALPGQKCDHPKVVTKLNLLADSFTTTDGVTGIHDATGKEDGYIDIKQGWPVNCTFTNAGTYRRAAAAR